MNSIGDNAFARLRGEVENAIAIDQRLKEAKDAVDDLTERRNAVFRDNIPMLMAELGIDEIKVDNHKVTLRSDAHPALLDGGIKWLDDNGFGGLIKSQIIVTFGRDEREQAIDLSRKLRESGLEVEIKENVHFQTLRSFARERISQGLGLPPEHFSINSFTEAKISG